ncbi:MAG: DUF1738 domain-containing protein [Saprospiraceae bacterium]|nr:DUF1738 domain-containing protein [Saprospiraceae bacterium]
MVRKFPIDPLYEEVTNRIIELIENGVAPWRMPWSTYGLARNYLSGRFYTGINFLLMNNTKHPVPYFMTFKQVKELGGKVKSGSKSEMVIYFKIFYKDENNFTMTDEEAKAKRLKGEEIKILRFIRYFNVFNIEDIEGVELDLNRFKEVKLTANERNERCEYIIKNMPNPPEFRQIDANRAYYSPKGDYINLPSLNQFESAEHYYATSFHEMIHSTGHESRLARPAIMDMSGFGSKSYSHEELIAEVGANYISNHCQIDFDSVITNSASYLADWLEVLQEDSMFIFKVSAEAQRAVDYILCPK